MSTIKISNVIASKKNKILGSYLVDAVGLNGWVNEFGDELAFEVLSNVCFIDCYCSYIGSSNRTSKKNFLAPTLRAFFSAATKSLLMCEMEIDRW